MAEVINPAIVPKVTLPSGEQVPCVGMGTFGSDRVSAEDVSAAVAGAIRSGYRMFDCAACYGNEHEIGQVFKDAFDEGVVERKDLFIMTKVWNDMSASCHLSDIVQCDSSDKQSMVCVWGKIFSVYFNRLFKIIYASGNWHMGDVFCYDSYGHRNNRRQGSDL